MISGTGFPAKRTARETGFFLQLLTRQLEFLLFFSLIFGFGFRRFGKDRAVALTFGTPTMGAVERKHPRVQFIKGAVGFRTEEVMAMNGGLAAMVDGVQRAPAQRQGLGNESGQIFPARLHLCDQDIDVVFPVTVQRLELGGLDPFAVDAEQGKSLFLGPARDLGMKSLATPDQGSQQAQVFGRAKLGADPFDDIRGGLANGSLAGVGIVLHAQLGVEQAEKLVELRDRGDRGFAASAGGPLFNGHGGR